MSQAVAQQAPNRTAEVQQQVNEVIGIMHTNIDKVSAHGNIGSSKRGETRKTRSSDSGTSGWCIIIQENFHTGQK